MGRVIKYTQGDFYYFRLGRFLKLDRIINTSKKEIIMMERFITTRNEYNRKEKKADRKADFLKLNFRDCQWLIKLSIALYFLGTVSVYGRELWSANFESPDYIANTYLTTQQDWWHYQGWSAGKIETFGSGQRAKIGGTNGWGETVLAPWVQDETLADKRFHITMNIIPGNGNNPFNCRVLDNIQLAVVNITFDASTGHILVKGGDSATWIDTGFSYSGGTEYKLEIIKIDSNWTFALKVNDAWIARNIPSRNPISVTGGAIYNTVPGIGYLYFSGGGNGGVPLASAFTYLDNIKIEAVPDYDRVWTSDFESPPYTLNTTLTGQQGWWHYQDWSQGLVSSYSQSQQACLGGSSGYPNLVLSPWISKDDSEDKRFRILATVSPGAGSNSCLIRVLDNNQSALININFDMSSGNKIQAKGTDSAQWIDTGVVYTPGEDYRLEILQNNKNNTFSLCVNESWVLREVPTEVTCDGFGYIYILAGGNDGTPISNQYSYLDDLSVQVLPEAEQNNWAMGAWDRLDSPNVPVDLANEGANTTVAYWYPGITDEQVNSWLDQAYLNGIEVLLEPPRANGYISSDTTLVTNYVNKFKKHPAVCGWYIADEPPINDTTADNTVKAGYDLIKSLDDKPVFICFTIDAIPAADIPATFNTYADSYDIMLFDCYITVKDTPEFNYIITSTFQSRIDLARSYANAAGKSWRAVLQGYGRTSNTNQWWARLPTIDELKFMLYYSIEKDAQGWFSWCHFLCKEETYAYASDPYPYNGAQWIEDVYKPLADEINILAPALEAGKKPGLTDNKTDVLSCLYQDPQTQEYYILAVNNYNGDNTVTFNANSISGSFSYAQPLFEGRSSISITNGEFSDQFSRYRVHVYKLIQ
jgi:hypothetical protein